MTKYKPEGFADAFAFDTLDQAVEAAKRQASPRGTSRIFAITEVAVVDTDTITRHNVTYRN